MSFGRSTATSALVLAVKSIKLLILLAQQTIRRTRCNNRQVLYESGHEFETSRYMSSKIANILGGACGATIGEDPPLY